MQLICEAYDLLQRGLNLSADDLSRVFADWNQSELDSYLIEISSHIFAKKDEDGEPIVDKILDAAGQKGTGKWTVFSSLDLGQPVTLIGESVFSRCLSALKDERVAASFILQGPDAKAIDSDRIAYIECVRNALYCSKIISYAQGYMLLRAAAKENGWNLNMGGIALMWRGGCIIRSRFLGKSKKPLTRTRPWITCCWTSFLPMPSIGTSRHGAKQSFTQLGWACPRRHFQRPWHSSMATARRGCRLICCRRSAIILARTPTNALTSRAGNSFTPTGQDTAANIFFHIQRLTANHGPA